MRALMLLAALACALPVRADEIPPQDRRSGFEMMGADVQAMQRDDFSNPAMLSLKQGQSLWQSTPPGKSACKDCHGDVARMAGVAARYPALDAASGIVIDLPGRIQQCQSVRQGVPASARESEALLALETLIGHRSRDSPIEAPSARGLSETVSRGRALYTQRMGQLDLSCAQCHSQNWGKSLGGTRIPQAHRTGYPIFRMEWQAMGSLQRRFRNCLTGVRAEPFAFGAQEWIALEAYLKERAAGMMMDAPAVRP